MFRHSVQELTKFNIQDWLMFLRKFVLPDYDDSNSEVWKISDNPLLILELKNKDRQKQSKQTKKKGAKEEEENLIFYEPSQEVVLENLQAPLNMLIETINSFIQLEPDIVRMLNLKRESSFNVGESLPIFKEALEYVEELVNKGFKEPNEILDKFKEYEFLLYKSKEEIVKSFLDKDKEKRSVEALDEYLEKVNESVKKLQGLCINEKNGTFFQIRTQQIKETLILKAKDILSTVLTRISSDCVSGVEKVNENYKTLHDRMIQEPEIEEDLIALNQCISSHEDKLKELNSEVNLTSQFIDLLGKYGFHYDEEAMVNFWVLRVCPLEVKIAVTEGKRIANLQEQNFMNRLENDKKEFDIEMAKLKYDFENLKR